MGKQIIDRVKKTLGILLLVLFIVTLTAASVSAQKTLDVSIKGNAFNPNLVEVSTADTVRWTNMDSVDYTVTGSNFNSGLIHKGQSYELKFNTPGSYDYQCSIHPSMKGTVKVVL
jgi:plastocyanin